MDIKRFWILLSIELKAWCHDPITALGGFIPPLFILMAFSALFGGRLTFKLAVVSYDAGPYGAMLRDMFDEALSPFGTPYYDVSDLSEASALQELHAHRIDGVWIVPSDFSERMAARDRPTVEMHFSNYNDDRAKNHRIYAAEILWRFYEKAGRFDRNARLPDPPLARAETYPREELVEWFPVIAVGVALLSFMLGGMMNVFMLTRKEHIAGVTVEFGLAPRPLAWVLLPKTLLALLFGLATGTILLGIVYLWTGAWPGRYLPAVWLVAGLVILFWVPPTLLFGFRSEYFAGAIATILTGLTTFFAAGGLASVRYNWASVPWFSWLFPNTYAVDPMRDLVLFHEWPADWAQTVLTLSVFATASVTVGMLLAGRRLRQR